MTQEETHQNFSYYRKKIYASINGTKGNMTKLSNSSLLNKQEREAVKNVISSLENLRIIYKKRH